MLCLAAVRSRHTQKSPNSGSHTCHAIKDPGACSEQFLCVHQIGTSTLMCLDTVIPSEALGRFLASENAPPPWPRSSCDRRRHLELLPASLSTCMLSRGNVVRLRITPGGASCGFITSEDSGANSLLHLHCPCLGRR